MNADSHFVETEEADEIADMGDLLVGFAWHDEGKHWHVAGYSFPENFTDGQVERLEALAHEMANRLMDEGLVPTDEGLISRGADA